MKQIWSDNYLWKVIWILAVLSLFIDTGGWGRFGASIAFILLPVAYLLKVRNMAPGKKTDFIVTTFYQFLWIIFMGGTMMLWLELT